MIGGSNMNPFIFEVTYMIKQEINGDIFHAFMNKDFDVFIQGCNCFCVQGGGIAGMLSSRYPCVLEADRTTVVGDKSKLGTYTLAQTVDGIVINAYTQYTFGYGGLYADYDAIGNVFKKIDDDYKDTGLVFGIPMIGCGLAGGDWSIVKNIINESTPNITIKFYYI